MSSLSLGGCTSGMSAPASPSSSGISLRAAAGKARIACKRKAIELDENGNVRDTANGGTVMPSRSRATSRHVPKKTRVSASDELIQEFNIFTLQPVTDYGVMSRMLVNESRKLHHHSTTPDVLLQLMDFAMYLENNPLRCKGNLSVALDNLHALKGHVLPLRYKFTGKTLDNYRTKLEPPRSPEHPYALQPVFVSLVLPHLENDAGGIMMQGVLVSSVGVNYPVGDPRRLCASPTSNDIFDDLWALLLVTHTYKLDVQGPDGTVHSFAGVPWSAITPSSYKRGKLDEQNSLGRNLYDDTYQWDALRQKFPKASVYSLHEIKQAKSLLRKLCSDNTTVQASYATVVQKRRDKTLQAALVKAPGQQMRRDSRNAADAECSNDVRKILLTEQLLMGSPLQGVLTGQASDIKLPAVKVPEALHNTGHVFTKLREFLSEQPGSQTEVEGSYEDLYRQWCLKVHEACHAPSP